MAILSKYDFKRFIIRDRRQRVIDPPKFRAHRCSCRSDRDGKCYDDQCDNVARAIECPSRCGHNCKNQMFRNSRNLPKVEVKPGLVGLGLFTKQNIKRGDFILQYFGEVIAADKRETRRQRYQRRNKPNYFFDVGRYTIDPTRKGNDAKYANHSCEPNMIARKWRIDNTPERFYALGFKAARDIKKGEELTLDYSHYYGNDMECKCGSDYCSGIIGKQLTRKERKEREAALNRNAPPRRSRAQARNDARAREAAEAERAARARRSASAARDKRARTRSRSRHRSMFD